MTDPSVRVGKTTSRLPSVGDPVPDLVLARLDGTPIDLRTYRGTRLALFFWGSW
jgi:peroxiredoxin